MAFKMKGPSLYRKGYENMKDGRSKSAAFQMNSPMKEYNTPGEYKVFNMGNKPDGPFKQTDADLKDWLLGEKGFSQVEADQMIETGAYSLDNKEFKKWYAKKGDVPAEPSAPMKQKSGWDTDGDGRMNDKERAIFLKGLGLTEKQMQNEMARLSEEYGDDDYDLDQYIKAANALSKKNKKSTVEPMQYSKKTKKKKH